MISSILRVLAVLATLGYVATAAVADDTTVPDLLIPVSADLEPAEDSDPLLLRCRYVVLDSEVFDGLQSGSAELNSKVRLKLFDDVIPTLVLSAKRPAHVFNTDTESLVATLAGHFWRGRFEDDFGIALLTANVGELFATAHTRDAKRYTITRLTEAIHVVNEYQVSIDSESTCGAEVSDAEFPEVSVDNSSESGASGYTDGGSNCNEACDDGTRIQLLVYYTSDAAQVTTDTCTEWPDAKIRCRIVEAVDIMNQALINGTVSIFRRDALLEWGAIVRVNTGCAVAVAVCSRLGAASVDCRPRRPGSTINFIPSC